MLAIPPDFGRNYAPLSANHGAPQRPYYLKWLRYHLDFCQKFALTPTDRRSFTAFDEKLREKNQSDDQRRQARQAVAIDYRGILPNSDPIAVVSSNADKGPGGPIPVTDAPIAAAPREPTPATPIQPRRSTWKSRKRQRTSDVRRPPLSPGAPCFAGVEASTEAQTK